MVRRRQSSLRREGNTADQDVGFSADSHQDTIWIDTSQNDTNPSRVQGSKVYPSSLSNGRLFSRSMGSKSSGLSGRSNSLALSEAEGGNFKASDPLLDTDNTHSPRFTATSFSSTKRISMPSILRNWSARRILFVLIIGFILFTFILSPTTQREKVLSKANKAWEEGLDLAEDYWDVMRKQEKPNANAPSDLSAQLPSPPSPVDGKSGLGQSKSQDQEPHVIGIPPMQAGEKVKDSSILDAVRIKPALHADREKSTRCESNGGKVLDWRGQVRPVVQYAIMIDAGSTGSRVHVYKFNFCSSSPELEDEVFEMIQGGLSSFKTDSRGAALSLKPLMETAMKSVPESLRACTPVAVKATAGLRLLGADLSSKILQAVREMLQNEYPFPIADGGQSGKQNGIEIMEGRDEGVFAWITINYLLNRIGSDGESTGTKVGVKTAAVMDLGGASTQIVFEPFYKDTLQGMHPGEHVYELSNFGGQKYTLYQNSYLGYGLMEARKSINSLSFFTYGLTHPDMTVLAEPPKALTGEVSAGFAGIKIPSSCFAEGMEKVTKVRRQGTKEEVEVTMIGTPGGYDACKRLVEVMMDKNAVCKQSPCSFAGVYQPSLMDAFENLPIIALSYFYDRLAPLGVNETFPLSTLTGIAKKVCAPSSTWATSFPIDQYPKALKDLQDRPESCLDFLYLSSLLSLGYELSDDRPITVAKKLGGVETSWSLGSSIVLMNDGNLCKK